jgi:hypothetical protein
MLTIEMKREFSRLAGELSPENLHCDGELPLHLVRQKKRKLDAEWVKLEQQVGRKVTEDEVFNWYR